MKYFFLPILAICIAISAFAQLPSKILVLDSTSNKPIPNVTISLKGGAALGATDQEGYLTLVNSQIGTQTFVFSSIGYEKKTQQLVFPLPPGGVQILLAPLGEALEMITISSTRSSRSIENIPTRVEFIAGEELEEKANMKPGDIRMMLSESTGVQTQQTSAISANAAIRIQGLDGRYTQLLKDGFPLYAGAASGLGLLQIAPLDLKQVELIKGSASTLYGGGAIAGLVNLISKTPKLQRELNFHLDATDARGLSLNGFYGKRNEKIGTTLFAAYQNNTVYDPAGIDLSAIPKSRKITFNPKLFLYPSERLSLILGADGTFEDRTGGDIHYIKGNGDAVHSYFEQNKTERISTQATLRYTLGSNRLFTLKNSFSYYNRILQSPGYRFDGIQWTTFTELNYSDQNDVREWTLGANLYSEDFKEKNVFPASRDHRHVTAGMFVQNLWKIREWLHLETGFRTDRNNIYGFVFLPRASALLKINEQLTSRLGGGLGYKIPTIFTEESERIQYRSVLPIDPALNRLEKSYGANWDVNYRTGLFDDRVSLTLNQLFFYTLLKNPLELVATGSNYRLVNENGNLQSKGMETNLKLGFHDFKLFMGYTFTDAHQRWNGQQRENPLTARHRINALLMYEQEEKWKVGLEAYSFSRQLLTDGSYGKRYLITGFMAEKIWERLSIYINFENFLDVRQSRFEQLYTGSISSPQFRDIYAPLDGFVINGGIKLRL